MCSMISGQCDKLRELAIRANELHEYEMERELDQAADTIWQLRDDLQRVNAENAKLHTQLADVTESMGRVEERCAELRELAERSWKTAERLCQAFDGPCRADDVTAYKPCPMGERDEECVYGQLQRDLRETGIEVDS